MNNIKLLCFLLLASIKMQAQVIPISFEKRIQLAHTIVLGTLKNAYTYKDAAQNNIYTLHEIKVQTYLKNPSTNTIIGLIDLGGVLANEAQITCPSVHLEPNKLYVLMLDANNNIIDNKEYRSNNANTMQCTPSASTQGVITFENNTWVDIGLGEKKYTTEELLVAIKNVTKQEPVTPAGLLFNANVVPQQTIIKKTRSITTLTDGFGNITSTFHAGLKNNAAQEMIINGSGFGATVGTIQFANADDGGATNFTFPTAIVANYTRHGRSNDIVSWTNTQIRIRIPRNAGTGTMNVFNTGGTNVGSANITIDWTEIPVYSNFSGFGVDTSGQQVEQLNRNTTGGYTFQFSSAGTSSFFADAAAKLAFERAVFTWRCGTLVNWDIDKTTATAAGFTGDNISVVMYDNTLPAGVLGRCTGRFLSSSNAGCTLFNTLWYVREMDVQFINNSSTTLTGIPATWNYNASGTTFSQFSFESVALHELGHGIGMGHVIDNTKIMNYSISNGSDKTVLASTDIAGASYKLAHSTATHCITNPSPMIALSSAIACFPLPIVLANFTGKTIQDINYITWNVTQEVNVKEYKLQRSKDGVAFETIATITANNKNIYTYNDATMQYAKNYYRLLTVDNDGHKEYSTVILLQNEIGTNVVLYPNPVTNILYINSTHTGTTLFDVTLLNAIGEVQYSKKNNATAVEINTSNFSNGIYYIQYEENKTRIYKKILIQH